MAVGGDKRDKGVNGEATTQSQEYGIRSNGEGKMDVGLQMNQKRLSERSRIWRLYIYLLIRKWECRE